MRPDCLLPGKNLQRDLEFFLQIKEGSNQSGALVRQTNYVTDKYCPAHGSLCALDDCKYQNMPRYLLGENRRCRFPRGF